MTSDPFKPIWAQLIQICSDFNRSGQPMYSLYKNTKYYVEDCSHGVIKVQTGNTKTVHDLKEPQFQRGWTKLRSEGKNGTDLQGIHWKVKIILSYLPNVEYQVDIKQSGKRKWFLMQTGTHTIGTQKKTEI